MTDIIENIKNETDVFSKAKLINHVIKQGDLKLKELAKRLSITASYLCHLNRLNKLPDIIVDGYYSKLIKLSHLFIISRIKDQSILIKIYEKILSDNLTIKQTEDLIREEIYNIKDKGSFINKNDKEKLLNKLKNKYQDCEFIISQTRTKSKLIIEVKGNLEKTTKKIEKIINGLLEAKD